MQWMPGSAMLLILQDLVWFDMIESRFHTPCSLHHSSTPRHKGTGDQGRSRADQGKAEPGFQKVCSGSSNATGKTIFHRTKSENLPDALSNIFDILNKLSNYYDFLDKLSSDYNIL